MKLYRKAIAYIESKYDGYVINVIVAGKNGTADLIACIEGRFFAFEIKDKGDREKRLQDIQLDKVAKAGGFGGYVRSLDDIDDIVKNLKSPVIIQKDVKFKL